MNKHTELPLPLMVRRWDGEEWPDKRISIASGASQEALFINARYASIQQSENDAAFIVKACNNHYQLLEALKEVTEELHQLCGDEADDPSVGIVGWDFINEQIIPNAREAIKQAEADDE